tara:strand:- start:3473 stop:4069 length:597 start_codon:yes stop_codon:yes gene_type:complete
VPIVDIETFETLLKSTISSETLCDDYLLDDEVWLLCRSPGADPSITYASIKSFIREQFPLEKIDAHIVGSAKLGFSAAPLKWGNLFDDDNSDIDIAITSENLFDVAYREISHQYLNGKIRYFPFMGRCLMGSNIPIGENVTGTSEFLIELLKKSSALKRKFGERFSIHNEINFRIYRSMTEVRLYHAHGFTKLRKQVT